MNSENSLTEKQKSNGEYPCRDVNRKHLRIHKAVGVVFGTDKTTQFHTWDHSNRDIEDARDCNMRPATSTMQEDNTVKYVDE